MAKEDVLVLPKEWFGPLPSLTSICFLPWEKIRFKVDGNHVPYDWLPRNEAEDSSDFVQPIPCAVIRDFSSRYCAFRRTRDARADLKSKVSLVIGGHINRVVNCTLLRDLLVQTLIREIREEISVGVQGEPLPLGLVVDTSSPAAARHVAFLYEVFVNEPVKSEAPEEFSVRSRINNTFFTARDLNRFRKQFDPWSKAFFEGCLRLSDSHQRACQLHLASHQE